MTDELTLHTLDDAIEALDALVIGSTSSDGLTHYVVLSSNQTEPGIGGDEDFTLCGWMWIAGPRRADVVTCLECIAIQRALRGLGSRRDV